LDRSARRTKPSKWLSITTRRRIRFVSHDVLLLGSLGDVTAANKVTSACGKWIYTQKIRNRFNGWNIHLKPEPKIGSRRIINLCRSMHCTICSEPETWKNGIQRTVEKLVYGTNCICRPGRFGFNTNLSTYILTFFLPIFWQIGLWASTNFLTYHIWKLSISGH